MERIKKYHFDFLLERDLFVESFTYDKDKNLSINLNNCQINCLFKKVISFCVVDEGLVYEPEHREISIGFYQLKGNKYLEHYHGQNYRFHMRNDIGHYVVITLGEAFSVLSYNEPIITVNK